MSKSLKVLLLTALAAVPIASAAAQDSTANQTVPLDQSQGRYVLEEANDAAGKIMSAGSPNSRAVAGYSAANIQFTSENGKTDVSLAFSFDLESYKRARGPEDYYKVGRTRLGIVATAPIDTTKAGASVFSGDSLVTGSKLKLSVTHFSTTVGSGMGSAATTQRAYRKCVSDQTTIWAITNANTEGAAWEAQVYSSSVDAKLSGQSDQINFNGVLRAAAQDSKVGTAVQLACQPGISGGVFRNTGELVSNSLGPQTGFRRMFLPDDAKLTFWGVDASMGRDDHSFLDRTNFKLASSPRTSWEVGAYYGFINSDLTFSLRARAVYGQTYKDNDEAQICRTVSIPAGPECIKGPDGAPLRQRSGLVSIEARHLVTVKEGTQIAIGPQVTYRTEDKNVGVEVPIYLAPDEGGKLSGGLKAVYNSNGDEFAVGIFVGVPFSIFYN